MNILIYGGKGWIGSQFVELLKKNGKYSYILGKARVNNTDDLINEITNEAPTHIVSFIGRTHGTIGNKKYSTIDYLEQPGKLQENVRDNLFSPISLGLICKEKNIHLTYLGTGCIFKFDNEHPFGMEENGFTEESKPNFFGSGYSTVKGFTDRLMPIISGPLLNLRIRMPIIGSDNPRNFITKITTYEKICSIPNSMSVLPDLLPLVLDMMNEKTIGTMNLTNPGLVSHNEILEMYKELVDPTFTWKNFSSEEQSKILASERSNNFLETKKLESLYDVPNIKKSMRTLLQDYKRDLEIPKNKPVITKNSITDFIDSSETILLVTGGSGFIGSNFINMIMKKYSNINVLNFDAMYYCANKDNVKKCWRDSKRYKFIKGNLCSFDLVSHVINEHKPTHIIHFAAQSHVQTSFTDSLRYTQDNIVGTHTLLECCRLFGKVEKFIHVSTDEVYGESLIEASETHKTENSILCPTNPYAATKAGAELIAQSYSHSFNMPIIITRGNNVYGPNQYPEKLIPKFLKLLRAGEKCTIHGDGSSLRSFIHTDDVSSAVDIILHKGKIDEIYNIGSDIKDEKSVLEVTEILVKKIFGTDDADKYIEFVPDRPFNDKRYFITNNKLKSLGWDQTINFNNGIDMLLDL